jgi:hypothetical protein
MWGHLLGCKPCSQEDQLETQRAAFDVKLGFEGVKNALSDREKMSELMKSMHDPEIMSEAKKMMENPAFQMQMKALMGEKTMNQAARKAQDHLFGPAEGADAEGHAEAVTSKLAAVNEKIARALAGRGEANARFEARNAAAENLGLKESPSKKAAADRKLSGSQNAALGMASLLESMHDPRAMGEVSDNYSEHRILNTQLEITQFVLCDQAMELMKDPIMAAEARRMLGDPAFRASITSMQETPEFQRAITEGAKAMSQMMNDPDALAKMREQYSALRL